MEEKILNEGGTFDNSIRNLRMKKSAALHEIKKHFRRCKKKGKRPAVYYTGHGEIGTGDWCFHDGTIKIKELDKLLREEGRDWPWNGLLIVTDCCFI